MTKLELNNRYFKWMCNLVSDFKLKNASYKKLLAHLHRIEFYYILPMDENRLVDGVYFRRRFLYEEGIDIPLEDEFFEEPCSVLEMMIALAYRCEEQIMTNDTVGDRTGQWFWNMIVNLGLGPMNDLNFDIRVVDDIIERFLERDYEPNGKGGLIFLPNCPHDLRDVDIWTQMMWYLSSEE